MGYRPQIRASRGSGRGQKSQQERAKAKREKHQPRGRYLEEESKAATSEEIAERTISRLSRLGVQKFAVSPFSQYFDDWLVNLKSIISEFASSPVVIVDDLFMKESSEILSRVEREFEERRRNEVELEKLTKRLSDTNHLLVQIDAEYASKTREIGPKRNAEISRLTRNAHDLEEELEHVGKLKTSIFGLSKKAKARKQAEVTQKLDSSKKELELAVQNFRVEQEKLHDEYEKKKQDVIAEVTNLENQVEKLEPDGSLEDRREACEALANVVNSVLQRKTASVS
jgi:hypothetical protein